MDSKLLEVKKGVLHTFDGEPHEVEGGAYLSPEVYLTTRAQLEQLKEHRAAEAAAAATPVLVLGAAVAGLAIGYWLGRRDVD